MTTSGGPSSNAGQWRPEAKLAGLRSVEVGFVVGPLLSGLFFGLIAAALVLRGGTFARACGVGALAGGVMFTSTALALCIVMTAVREAPSR